MKFTPYNFVTSVMCQLQIPLQQRRIKEVLRPAKMLLEKLRSMGFDDDEILQMLTYTCGGMLKEHKPRTFPYFLGIMRNFIISYANSSVSEAPKQTYQEWIQQEIARVSGKSS